MKSFTSILLLALSATTLALPTQPTQPTEPTASRFDIVRIAAAASPSSSASPSTGASNTTTPAGGSTKGAVNPALVPDFGVKTNTNANAKQTGSCDGFAAATNALTLIPCSCPPSRAAFLDALNKNVAAGSVQGTPVKFNNNASDQSAATNQARGTAMLVTLQNLNGPGKGCPAASAPNFAVMQKTGQVSSKVFVG